MADADIGDITREVAGFLTESGLREGQATVFCVGSTGAISTIEYEPGLTEDMRVAFERIAPKNIDYEHHKTWHDDNGRSHVASTIIGTSLTVPFIDGKLCLGTWQQIVIMNLDTSPRSREVVIQLIGQ